MNIALIGYGKMGQAIERVATARGHQIILKLTSANQEDLTLQQLRRADVVIEFTTPDAAPAHIAQCFFAGVPVVCGTTGWNEQLEEAKKLAQEQDSGFLHASNFSIGVNLFFEINKLLARLMNGQPAYKAVIEEVHHLQKKDKPSGTAITLAEQLLLENDLLKNWSLSAPTVDASEIPIVALREEGVPGTHKVSWTSPVDTIDIVHTTHSRDGFALGAVLAAEFIIGKAGVFTMQDVLAIRDRQA